MDVTISPYRRRRYDAVMKVRVFPLRARGRRLDRPENLDGVPGDLRMYSQVHGS